MNGSFPSGYAMMSAIEAGQVMSPTQIHPAAMRFLPAHIHVQHPHMIPGAQDPQLVSLQHIPPGTPGGVVHFPGSLTNQSPSSPTTPLIGHMGFRTLLSNRVCSLHQAQELLTRLCKFSGTLWGPVSSPLPLQHDSPGHVCEFSYHGGQSDRVPSGSPAHAPSVPG